MLHFEIDLSPTEAKALGILPVTGKLWFTDGHEWLISDQFVARFLPDAIPDAVGYMPRDIGDALLAANRHKSHHWTMSRR